MYAPSKLKEACCQYVNDDGDGDDDGDDDNGDACTTEAHAIPKCLHHRNARYSRKWGIWPSFASMRMVMMLMTVAVTSND